MASTAAARRTLLRCLAFTAGIAAAAAAPAGPAAPAPRLLLVQVRELPPDGHAAFYRGADRSFTVSTGGGGDVDDQHAAGNGYTVGASNAQREMRLREGEAVRVDLPSVQSLQFHLPANAGKGTGGNAGATGAASAAASASPAGAHAGAPSIAGVVYFDAVSAFAARFRLQGARVLVELVPLRTDGVSAPWIGGGGARAGPILIEGAVGEWIALGDTDVPARSLSPTPEPPTPASVWVRVVADEDAAAPPPARGNGTVTGTSQRP